MSSYSDLFHDFSFISVHFCETITSSMLCEMDRKLLIQGLTWGFMAVVFNSVRPSCEIISYQSMKLTTQWTFRGKMTRCQWLKYNSQLPCWSIYCMSVFPTCKRSLNLADVLTRSDRQLSILACSPEPAPWLNNLEQSFCRGGKKKYISKQWGKQL